MLSFSFSLLTGLGCPSTPFDRPTLSHLFLSRRPYCFSKGDALAHPLLGEHREMFFVTNGLASCVTYVRSARFLYASRFVQNHITGPECVHLSSTLSLSLMYSHPLFVSCQVTKSSNAALGSNSPHGGAIDSPRRPSGGSGGRGDDEHAAEMKEERASASHRQARPPGMFAQRCGSYSTPRSSMH